MAENQILVGDCLEVMAGLPTGCARLAMTSPPYEDARLYKPLEFKAKGQAWVDWMIPRVVECCRVVNGLVFVNMAGKVRDFKYSPVVEWLVADLTRNHGIICGPAPYVFYRVGIPGSGGPHYHRRDWEPVYAFARPECLPPAWSDNTAMGHPPKWAPGGEMSNRLSNGARVNQWGMSYGQSKESGKNGAVSRTGNPRPSHRVATNGAASLPAIANPGNVIHCLAGGGHMGDSLAHDNEAPFPESLVEFFIRSFAPEDSVVIDPFCGSGTVCKVAEKWGRKFIGIDVRESMVELTRRRLKEHGHPLFADAP